METPEDLENSSNLQVSVRETFIKNMLITIEAFF